MAAGQSFPAGWKRSCHHAHSHKSAERVAPELARVKVTINAVLPGGYSDTRRLGAFGGVLPRRQLLAIGQFRVIC